MLEGNIRLSLMIGPVIPVPVGRDVIDALQSVTVRRATSERSGFQLVFEISTRSPLNALVPLLAQAGPFIRVVITVIVNGTPSVLMDGVVVNTQVSPGTSGRSTLTVTGSDLTAVMELISFTGLPYPALPREARVALIVAKYAVYGMIPLVIPSLFTDVPIPVQSIPTQQGTDLAYIKEMADQVGYVFYVDPGPAPLTNIAYWGPEIKVGVPQPALTVNMDTDTNVEALSFSFNGASKITPLIYIQEPFTKATIPIPIPDISPLNPPLAAIPPFPARSDDEDLPNTAHLNPVQAVMPGLAKAAKSADAVTATGSLNVLRYGRILKARALVGVRGVGEAFDGLYYVKQVTHQIRRGEYKQDFTLTRNGVLPTVPRVPA